MATENSKREFSIIAKIKADISEFKETITKLKGELSGTNILGEEEDSGFKPGKLINKIRDSRNERRERNVGDKNSEVQDMETKSKGVRGVLSNLKKKIKSGIKETAEHGSKHTTEFTRQFGREVPSAIEKATRQLDKFSGMLKTMFSLYAGKKLFDFTLGQGMEFETYEAGFKAVMGSAEKAKATMKEIEQFASKTPYNLDQLVRAGVTLESARLDSSKWMETAGNLASANSAKGTTIEYVAQILANIQNGNTGDGIAQLRNLGIGKEDLAKYGVRFSNSNQAKTPPKELLFAIEKAVADKFGDQMAEKSATAEGMISNIQDNIEMFGRTISETLFDEYKGIISEILALTDNMASSGKFKAIANGFSTAIRPVIEGIKKFIEWLNKALENGKLNSFFAGVNVTFQALGAVFSGLINVLKNVVSWLGKLMSMFGGVEGSAKKLSTAVWGLVSAFIAFKTATVIVSSLMMIYKALKLIRSGIQGITLAMKALQSSTIVGLLTTILTALLMIVMQLEPVKKFLGGLLDKLGMGAVAELLGLKDGDNIDDKYEKELAQLEAEMKKAEEEANNQQDFSTEDESEYKKGLDTIYRTAVDDIDIEVNRKTLEKDTSLQNLQLQGVYKDDGKYANKERESLIDIRNSYLEGMEQMKQIIAEAGDDIEWRDVKTQAETKLLEYQQKANEILLQIENNTNEMKNAIQMIDLRNNKFELEREIAMQETEIGGTREDTYRYWAKNREYLKQQMQDYRNAYERVKAMIPSLEGEEKIQAQIKSLEYLKKSNDLLLQIKKNTDPRNGTFNLPSDIKAWTLLEDRQAKGDSGVVVSGNNFVLNVKEVVDQNSINDIFNDIERVLYEKLDSDTRR